MAGRFASTDRYIATRDLEIAVNAAIALERPLLVKGEPGTGKTVLAEEVARALGLPLIQWHIKSTTKAAQGLYEYDAVARLRDGQLGNEKELPDAFLRRCFFHYIRFPDKETMERIVAAHYPDIKRALVREALQLFYDMREVPGLKKKPATSELLDWLKLLMIEDIPLEVLRAKDPKVVIPPLHGALLKNEQDVHLFERVAFLARRGQ